MPGQPIVIAHHIMWTLYGCWLPNDPRGSTSAEVESEPLRELGELHFGRKKIQPIGRDIGQFYEHADVRLRFPLLQFDRAEFEAAGAAIGGAVSDCDYTCWAMAVMPDHVHVLIRKHRDSAETMIEKLQALGRKKIIDAKLREHDHPVWTVGGWKVFLDHPDEVRRTISYVEKNPVKRGWPVQRWSWVKEYDGWPLHPGHSVNSPYVKALKAAGRYP